jgi:hypothetical protein
MTMKKTLIILIILFTTKLFGQSNYAKYIVVDSLKKTQLVKSSDREEKINYLGVIKKTNGDTLYYIFTVFTKIKYGHGHSNIIYLNKKYNEVKNYDASIPEQLPYKLKDNTLYFKYVDEQTGKTQTFKNKVGTTPPTIMCIGPNNCL